MTHASVFSGIGGFEIAAEWMGWENVFICEIGKFGRRVCSHYWPNLVTYGDIKKTNFTFWRGRIDVLSGGPPCQPYSHAGDRLGTEDDRHLWPEMRRAIREIAPRWVVFENVLGLTNWNGGMVFDEVQTDLEAQGYEVGAYVLPAAGKNAPHKRERIWIVAHNKHAKRATGGLQTRGPKFMDWHGGQWDFTNAKGKGPRGVPNKKGKERAPHGNELPRERGRISFFTNAPSGRGGKNNGLRNSGQCDQVREGTDWRNWPTQPPIRGRNDGIPRKLDGVTFSKWKNETIKAYGNAIVPQIALELFKVVNQINN